MNKTIKRILIGVASIAVLMVLVMGGFFLKMKSEVKNMHVAETKEIVSGVFSIKDSYVNMFLVKDSAGYVAIDAGADTKVIENELKRLTINPNSVKTVVLTHCDGDHTAALSLFAKAKVYFSRDEEQMINGKTAKMMFFHNNIPTTEYTLLDDNQMITVGKIKIRCIASPGHTPGSMSYLINDSLLFVGDAFGLKDGKVDKPNSFFSKDMKTAIQSFAKIANLPTAKFIFTAHNGYSDNYKNAVNTQLE
jgi:glyoxylase-like metal-dependent hydrolase (beta-lactamase superfamily II)